MTAARIKSPKGAAPFRLSLLLLSLLLSQDRHHLKLISMLVPQHALEPVLLLVFVMMLLPPLPPLLTNHCRCSRLRAQGVTDRQHITALIRLCNATPAKPQA